jgi:cytochrome c556
MKQARVGVAFIVVVCAFAVVASADDESDRQDLIKNIEENIGRAADTMSGFESDSDDSDLRSALSYLSTAESYVSKLSDKKGSDSKAGEIASQYPRYLSDYKNAAQYIGRLKQGQRQADGAADRCQNDESNLQQMIRNYVGKPDDADDAPQRLPEKAREYQSRWQPALEQWKRNESEMANAASYARFSVSASDKWSRLSSNTSSAINAMHTHWRERYANAERACTRLGLGERHPDVEKALETLRNHTGDAKGTVTQLKKDYNAWLREVRQLRDFAIKDRDEIRAAICTAGEYDVPRRVNEVADRWASQISSSYGTMLGQADRLKSRAQADKLKKYKGPRQVLDGLNRNIETMEKMKNYELQGANNPKIRAKLEWGNKRHADLQSSIGCAFKEVGIEYCNNAIRPGSGCRADCLVISGSTCRVVEIKPDSTGGKSEGPAQVDAYMKGFIEWYKRDKASMFAKYPGMSGCQDRDELRIATDVVYYDFCSGTVRDELGDVFTELSSNLSEDSE